MKIMDGNNPMNEWFISFSITQSIYIGMFSSPSSFLDTFLPDSGYSAHPENGTYH
jgi:hypothetical protein